ncbi:MAG: RNA methyltransferase [Ignavibacteria bacterium]|nr:RNA methyltransferase [Ignavibacteria bacterium]
MTEKRLKKFKKVVSKRQKYLTLVLENIHDPHNVSAILRSSESVGIDKIYLIYNDEKFPKISPVSSASAKKWVELVKFTNVDDCFKELKKQKYKIYSTHMAEGGKNESLFELDLTKRTALVFGNEHRGVSDEIKEKSDSNFLIPMVGMVQSLNVSVSVAVCIYEAMRQRIEKGMYKKSGYTKKELSEKLEKYLNK